MSKFGGFIRVVLVMGSCVVLGMAYNSKSQAKRMIKQYHDNVLQKKAAYQAELKKSPSIKTVNTNLQKAMNTTKLFVKYQDQLHTAKIKKNKSQVNLLNQKISDMVTDVGQYNSPLVPIAINNWHSRVYYGGETSDGHIAMGIEFYNNKNVLMSLISCSYDTSEDKLTQFMQFPTNQGQVALQKSLIDPGIASKRNSKGGH